jgi:putative heme-binding domain-containing protein
MSRASFGGSLFAVVVLTVCFSSPSRGDQDPYGEFVAKTEPRSPADELKTFHLPPGFQIELVASEPEIIKPINMNFDARGRLWVTQSVEYPFPAVFRKPRDTIKIIDLKAKPGPGRVTTFADGLNIPIGILPITQGALVYSIPNILRLSDPAGRDRAEKRQVFFGTFGFRDTHGMASNFTWGFDGWVYACHGFSNKSTVKGADAQPVTMESGNTYRFKPDGTHVEQFTHGQVNPFGLAFDPLGNLYSADCHTKPVMALLRGGYYDSFGKAHDGLGYAPEMAPNYDRSTAIAGIVYYAAEEFPKEYRDSLFFGDVVVNQINQYHLEPQGSSFKAVLQPKFLTCDDPWFRPVSVILGPDGALYVADFYNRIIGHYEVPLTHKGRDHERGRIWRIVYRGPDGQRKPTAPRTDWSAAPVADLIGDLAHPNLVVRTLATNQLVERGGQEAVAALRSLPQGKAKPTQRMHGLWILERLHALEEPTLAAAAKDTDRGVRVHALRILADRAELTAAQHKLVEAALTDSDPFVQRTGAEVLGTHPGVQNIRPLLTLRQAVPKVDTHLLYVVRMALRNQLRADEVWAKLPTASWSEVDRRAVADVCPGVPSAQAAAFLLTHLKKVSEPNANLVRYVHHIARYGDASAESTLLAFARAHNPADPHHQASLFKEIQQGTQERGAKLSAEARQWASDLATKLLASKEAGRVSTGAELAGSQRLVSLQPTLQALARRKALPEPQRRACTDALAAIDAKGNLPLLSELLADAAEPLSLRQHAAELLADSNRPEAQSSLVKALAVSPAGLQNTIALGLSRSAKGAEQLVAAVTEGKASARLLQEWGVHLELAKQAKLKEQVAKLTQGLPAADTRLQELIKKRHDGFATAKSDPASGLKVFEKHCAICHQLGGKGAKVGPQLDGVGIRGLDRLLEDLIDPNRNVDQAFRATTLVLKNGRLVVGLVLREEGEIVILADNQGKEVRVPKNTIDERTVSQTSPMPANLIDQIPETDFYHLLRYLLTQKQTAEVRTGK